MMRVVAGHAVHVVDHPVVQHRLAALRDETTEPAAFRLLVRELSTFIACDEATLRPEVYLERIPRDLRGRRVVVCDPMLATGGSLVEVCDLMSR